MLKVAGGVATGTLSYQGTWDASTNTPTLTSSVGTQNQYYVVSVAGSTNLNGITDWQIGDWAIFNGTVWQKIDQSNSVTSVNGQTGAVVLTAVNVGATPNTAYVLAGSGMSGGGQLTGNVTLTNAGVTSFNTRNGAVTLTSSDVTTALGYTPGTGNGTVTSVTGTSPVVSSGGTTPAISMPAANSTTNGYLTSTDWGTFNNKGTGNGTVTSVATGTGLTGGTITSSGTIALANTAVTAGTYGTASQVSQVTIDAQGRITSAANVAIAIANSAVSGLGTMSTQNANNVAITGGNISSVTITGGTYANANITSVAATFPNNYLANSSTTLGNTALTLGSTTSSVGNLTLTNVTVSSGAVTANITSSNVNLTGTTASTATFATSSLPLVPEGYITVQIGGVNKKIPYYGV